MVVRNMEDILAITIFSGIALLALFFIPALMTKMAIFNIIRIFCRHDAVGNRNAKSVNELGLRQPDIFQRLLRPRDYKPYALQVLRQAGIIKMTDDEKLYMVEDRLDERLRCNRDLYTQDAQLW